MVLICYAICYVGRMLRKFSLFLLFFVRFFVDNIMTCRTLPDWGIFSKIPPELIKEVTAFHVFGTSGSDVIFCTGGRHGPKVFRGQLEIEGFTELVNLRGHLISKVVTSERGAILLLTNGSQLYAFGNNQYGQVANSESGASVREPFNIQIPNPGITHMALSCYHCACVNEIGDLYTWGGWRAGDQLRKLGHIENCLVPNKVEQSNNFRQGSKFIQVACNSETTYALDDQGRVYSCGDNKFLSFNTEKIVQISCATGHSLALSSYGSVFAWGKNYRKQLGLQIDDDPIKEPRRIPSFDNPYTRIISVLAFNTMSLALSHNGIPYVWGETRLSGKVQFYFAQAERELDEKNKNSNNYYYWMLPRTCINSIPTPASATAKWSLFAAVQEEVVGPMVTPHLIQLQQGNNKEERQHETDSLIKMFDDPMTSDFQINVRGQVIHAHKAILLNRSAHFRTMLSPCWRESSENVLEIKDVAYPVYRAFIFYLYKGFIPDGLTLDEAICLLDIADLYFHDELRTKVYDYALANWLTKEDVFELCGVALKKHADMIVSRCTSFILNNLTAVTKLASFDKLLNYIDAKDILAIYQKANQAQLFKT